MTKISLIFGLFLLALGSSPCASLVINWAAIADLVSDSVVAGATMGAAALNLPFTVVVKLEIENWTKYQLSSVAATVGGGRINQSPTTVRPGKKELMVAHKNPIEATGSYGVISWKISGKNRRVVVMWSAPFSFDWHRNYLAVGLTNTHVTAHNTNWFGQMYHSSSGYGLNFMRKEYYSRVSHILFDDTDFQIVASMGTSHKPTASVIIRPKNSNDIALSLRGKLRK